MTPHRSASLQSLVRIAAGAMAISLLATLVWADNPEPSPAEKAIKYRQGVYKAILWNFGPMSAAAQGKAPYDQAAFAKGATRVSQLAPMLLEGYPPGSQSAPNVKTRAKPEIWDNMDEFTRLMHSMEDKAANLAKVAQSGDEKASKAAFFELGDACKACHDKYRTK
jgi:cytochrome c556